MKIIIDSNARTLFVENGAERATLDLYSTDAFRILSHHWLRVGWSIGHWQTFQWHGQQLLQLPEDVLRLEEAVLRVAPDVIVETGVFSGGGSVMFAGLCRILGKGRVVSVELNLRPEVREALATHPLASYIDVLEGSSTSPAVLEQVRARIAPGARVLVFLDSDHSKQHVAAELEAYAPMVSVGSYLIAADGVMRVLSDVRGGTPAGARTTPPPQRASFWRGTRASSCSTCRGPPTRAASLPS